jgi:hypothetical protein
MRMSKFFITIDAAIHDALTRIKIFFGMGRWQVVYNEDGKRSRPMCRRIAEDYAEMFGGHLIETDRPIYDLGLRRWR